MKRGISIHRLRNIINKSGIAPDIQDAILIKAFPSVFKIGTDRVRLERKVIKKAELLLKRDRIAGLYLSKRGRVIVVPAPKVKIIKSWNFNNPAIRKRAIVKARKAKNTIKFLKSQARV